MKEMTDREVVEKAKELLGGLSLMDFVSPKANDLKERFDKEMIILKSAVAIAEKSLEVRICEGCEYWNQISGDGLGLCGKEHTNVELGESYYDFGCIHWQKKVPIDTIQTQTGGQ